jgi:Rrf2 family protein
MLEPMRLSRASTYALYGLSYLASQDAARLVPLSEIHERVGVPEKHLGKIFRRLVRARLLRSERGARGGFALARPAARISPLEVIEAVDGRAEAGCLLIGRPCRKDAACRINDVWRRAQQAMLTVLREANLDDIVQGQGFRPPRARLITLRRS